MLPVLMKRVRWVHLEQIWRWNSMHTNSLISVMQCVHVPRLLCVCVCVLNHFSCVSLCNPMDCSPPGSSVHGTLQARILEWAAVPSSRESSQPGVKPMSLTSLALAGGFFTTSATWDAKMLHKIKITSRLYFLLWDDPIWDLTVTLLARNC